MGALSTVVLITGSFPYSYAGEGSFLAPELPSLGREFARVIIVPALRRGERADLPSGIEVDDSLATDLAARQGSLRALRDALACAPGRAEIRRRLPILRSLAALRRLVAFAVTATRVARWYEGFAVRHRLDSRLTLLYSYWIDALSAGLLLARVADPSLVVISRGHRGDVYEEEQSPPYLPCRDWLMSHLDRIFLISDDARSYLQSRHPEAVERLVTSRLGTPDPGFLASPSTDGILRVVSCSAFLPVKQVDVLARGLMLAARDRPDRRIEWLHFGDGPVRPEVEARLNQSALSNLSWTFRGHVANTEVLDHYRSQPNDLFVNTSRSEGIPVAIMEAQSCGIPTMAPTVGGIPEIVSSENGFILPAPATPTMVAETVCSLVSTPSLLAPRRDRSRRDWESRFQAGRNFGEFARALSTLRREGSGGTR